jgi:hypothetical protein
MSNEEITDEISEEMKELLKQALTPMQNTELRRDLWPQMLRKLDEPPLPIHSVPWFDWVLAAILSAVLIFSPGFIPTLLYHL